MSTGRFKLGERVIAWHSALPCGQVGPAVVTEKEFRVFIGAASGRPVTGWGYRTDLTPSDGAWLAEGCLRPMPEPADPLFTAQLFAELGVRQ